MRKLMLVLPLLLLGCGNNSQEQLAAQSAVEARQLLAGSSVVCADGNQVRFVIYTVGGNASSFTAWTILDEDGKPKRCVKRAKAIQPQYEEVPQ